jgi:hypothetical protein
MDEPFKTLAETAERAPAPRAGSRLKSRVYTALVRLQSETGPLASVSASKAAGRALCVFEELVRISPASESFKSAFLCNACHARVLAERLRDPPIWWPHCPYVGFKKG